MSKWFDRNSEVTLDTQFRNLTTNNVNLNTPEGEERLSTLSTETFKERLQL